DIDADVVGGGGRIEGVNRGGGVGVLREARGRPGLGHGTDAKAGDGGGEVAGVDDRPTADDVVGQPAAHGAGGNAVDVLDDDARVIANLAVDSEVDRALPNRTVEAGDGEVGGSDLAGGDVDGRGEEGRGLGQGDDTDALGGSDIRAPGQAQ